MKLDFRIFVPNLAGATLRDRLFACLGALIGIGVTGAICSLLYGANPHLPLLVAPMGASAVLLFAVPSSPLAQPWSILGGNTISALVGVTAARAIHDPAVAAAPPVNAHGTADEPASRRVGFRRDDIDAALADMHESFDIDRADLDRLLEQVELRAFARVHGDLRCLDLMSRDLVKLRLSQDRAQALRLLLDHGLRILPVVDDNGRLIGAVGLRELAGVEGPLEAALSPPATATPESPAFDLLAPLVDGQTRAVFIVDAEESILHWAPPPVGCESVVVVPVAPSLAYWATQSTSVDCDEVGQACTGVAPQKVCCWIERCMGTSGMLAVTSSTPQT